MRTHIPSMRTKMRLLSKVLILSTLLTAACAQSTVNFQSRWQGFVTHLSGCTATHGYDPDKAVSLGEHQLGKNELAWRTCAYAGVEQKMIRGALDPNKFLLLVQEDRVMTEGILRGSSTRTARKTRVLKVLGQIKQEEDAYRQKQIQQLRQMQDDFERQRRFQEMQRNIIDTNALRRAATSKF